MIVLGRRTAGVGGACAESLPDDPTTCFELVAAISGFFAAPGFRGAAIFFFGGAFLVAALRDPFVPATEAARGFFGFAILAFPDTDSAVDEPRDLDALRDEEPPLFAALAAPPDLGLEETGFVRVALGFAAFLVLRAM